MNKRIKNKKRKQCNFCGRFKNTKEIYWNLQLCEQCLLQQVKGRMITLNINE